MSRIQCARDVTIRNDFAGGDRLVGGAGAALPERGTWVASLVGMPLERPRFRSDAGSWHGRRVGLRSRLWRWVMPIVLAVARTALADDPPDPQHDIMVIPAACAAYWVIPGGDDSPAGWNQALSFAACVQDASIEQVDDPAQLPALVEQLTDRLSAVMPFYFAALERGPGPIQLRAAYQIGMAHLSLLVRARASIVATADPRTSATAAARLRELHARLEPLLARSARVALVSFMVVERAAATHRQLAPDDVTAYMVRSAHQLVIRLRRDWPDAAVRELVLAFPP